MPNSDHSNRSANLSVEELLEQAGKSGLTYNQAKAFIAKTTGGHGTAKYSDTNAESVKKQIHDSGQHYE